MCAPCCIIICQPGIAISARALAATNANHELTIAAIALADTLDNITQGLLHGHKLGNFSGEEDMIFAAAEKIHPWVAEIDGMRAAVFSTKQTDQRWPARLDQMKAQATDLAREIVLASQKRLTASK